MITKKPFKAYEAPACVEYSVALESAMLLPTSGNSIEDWEDDPDDIYYAG